MAETVNLAAEFAPPDAVATAEPPPDLAQEFQAPDKIQPAESKPQKQGSNPFALNESEFRAASPLGRLKMMLSHPWDKYAASVDQGFSGAHIPRVEAPKGTDLESRVNQLEAGTANVVGGVAGGAVSPGAVIAITNPLTLAYSAPRFVVGGISEIIDAVKGAVSGEKGLQETFEKGVGGALMLGGGALGAKHATSGLIPEVAPKTPGEAVDILRSAAEKTDDPTAKAAFEAAAVKISQKTGDDALVNQARSAVSGEVQKPPTTAELNAEPVPAATPETAKLEASSGGVEKLATIKEALKSPDTVIQYSVWDREMLPPGADRTAQVDLINPKDTQSVGGIASTSRGLLQELGVDVPPAPEWLKPGAYTLDQIKAAIAEGPPKIADEFAPPDGPMAPFETASHEMKLSSELDAIPVGEKAAAAPEPLGVVPPGTVNLGEVTERVSGALSDLKESAKKTVNEIRDVPKFTPFKESVNEWFGSRQKNTLSVREVAKKLQERLPDKETREAVTNYIQAGGDGVTLEKWRAATTDNRRKAGYERALKLSEDEKAVADQIKSFYEGKLQEAKDWGIIDEGIPNYVNQIWREQLVGTPPHTSEFGGRLSQSFRSAKQRSFENFFEGEQAGYKPATKDISELMALYSDGLNKAIATKKLIRDLTQKKASDGRMLAEPIGSASVIEEGSPETDPLFIRPRARGEEVSDYRAIDNPALYKWKWIGEENGKPIMLQGQLGLHPEIYQHMKDMLGRSAIREWYDKPSGPLKGIVKGAVRGLDRGGQLFKGMSLGFLSPFHQIQEATHAVGHKINPFTNLPDLKADNAVLSRGVSHGLALAGERGAMEAFGEGLGGAAHNNPLWKLPVVGKWAQDYSTWLFNEYIPKLKLKTYEAIEQRNTKLYKSELADGKVSKDQISYLSAQQTNAAYGHLNYADIGRNPTLQHILQMTLLAPDFLEARGRFVGQAAQGLVSKVGREQLVAIGTLAATFWIASRVLNKTIDDDYHWDHPFTVIHNGREYAMRSVPEDIYRLFKDSRAFISNRLSPLIGRGTVEFVTGRNWRGEKITWSQEVRDLSTRWIPINFQNNELVKKVGGSEANSPISQWEQFLSSSGLQVKRYSSINEAYQLAEDWKVSVGKSKDTGTYPVSKYRGLRYALEDGNLVKAQEEVDKLLKQGTVGKVSSGFHESLMRPFTGSKADDAAFIKSLDAKNAKMVNEAVALRQRIWSDFMKLKKQPQPK